MTVHPSIGTYSIRREQYNWATLLSQGGKIALGQSNWAASTRKLVKKRKDRRIALGGVGKEGLAIAVAEVPPGDVVQICLEGSKGSRQWWSRVDRIKVPIDLPDSQSSKRSFNSKITILRCMQEEVDGWLCTRPDTRQATVTEF